MRTEKGGQGLGEEIGRGEVIPGVLSIPFLERLSLSRDSCCGHTTNLKAGLPLRACLSSPPSPALSSSWCLAPRRSDRARGGQQRPLPPGQPSAAAASALHQGRPRLRGSASAASRRRSRRCPGRRLARAPPASPSSLPKETAGSEGGREEVAAGKAGFGSPAAPVGGCSGDRGVQ